MVVQNTTASKDLNYCTARLICSRREDEKTKQLLPCANLAVLVDFDSPFCLDYMQMINS